MDAIKKVKSKRYRYCNTCSLKLRKNENKICSICIYMLETNNVENIMEEEIKTIKDIIIPSGPLKQMFVDYVGNKLEPENGEVSLEMLFQVLGEEFPELLLMLAEQNFIAGYEQAAKDFVAIEKIKQESEGQVEIKPEPTHLET